MAEADRSGPGRLGAILVLAGMLLGVLAQLTVETPPALLAGAVAAASSGQLRLDDGQGGVWSGSGRLSWLRSGAAPVALGRWQWTWSLVHGAPGWRLQALQGPVRGGLALRTALAGPSLDDVALALRAEDLPSGLGPLDFLHARGGLALESPRVALAPGRLIGHGRLAWREAGSALLAVAPLGSWHADWEAGEAGATFQVATDAGPLHVEGHGQLAADGHPALQGRAWCDAPDCAGLQPVLQLLGQPAPDGSVAIAWH